MSVKIFCMEDDGILVLASHQQAETLVTSATVRLLDRFMSVTSARAKSVSKEQWLESAQCLALILSKLFSACSLSGLERHLARVEAMGINNRNTLANVKSFLQITTRPTTNFSGVVRSVALTERLKLVDRFPGLLCCPLDVSKLIDEILIVRRHQGIHVYEECAHVLETFFKQNGKFLYAGEETHGSNAAYPRSIYYIDSNNLFWNISDDVFDTLLRDKYGLPELTGKHKNVRSAFVDRLCRGFGQYPLVTFHRVSHYQDNAFYVDMGDGKVAKVEAEQVCVIPNGSDGVYLRPELLPWTYVPSTQCEQNDNLAKLTQFFVDPAGAFTQEQAVQLVQMWIVANFMRGMVTHRPLLNLIGEKGSGKTTLAENTVRVLLGDSHYTSTGMPRDERDFAALVHGRGILVLDNVEDTNYRWGFEDALARIYSSGTIEARKLYTDTDVKSFRPDAFVILTAINPSWGRADVADRSLVIQLNNWTSSTSVDERTSSGEHLNMLMSHRNLILSEIVDSLQRLLIYLQSHDLKEHLTADRMETFTAALDAWCQANQKGTKASRQPLWTSVQLGKLELAKKSDLMPTYMEWFIRYVLQEADDVERSRILDRGSQVESGKMMVTAASMHQTLCTLHPQFLESFPNPNKFATKTVAIYYTKPGSRSRLDHEQARHDAGSSISPSSWNGCNHDPNHIDSNETETHSG